MLTRDLTVGRALEIVIRVYFPDCASGAQRWRQNDKRLTVWWQSRVALCVISSSVTKDPLQAESVNRLRNLDAFLRGW